MAEQSISPKLNANIQIIRLVNTKYYIIGYIQYYQSIIKTKVPFSFMNDRVWIDSDKQLCTYMTYTNEEVAKIVKDTLHLNRHVREETRGPR